MRQHEWTLELDSDPEGHPGRVLRSTTERAVDVALLLLRRHPKAEWCKLTTPTLPHGGPTYVERGEV